MLTLAVATNVAGQTRSSGAVQGRAYVADEERTSQDPVIMVIPASQEQPVRIEALLPDVRPEELNRALEELRSTREGPGLVRPDARGEYAVTALAPGEYLVGSITPFIEFDVQPPEEVQFALREEVSTLRAFRVDVREGSATTVDIVLAAPEGREGPSRLKVCVLAFDDETSSGTTPDRISTGTMQRVNGDRGLSAQITLTLTSDGCAQFENIPAGTYTIAVETERGSAITREIEIGPGEDGAITLGGSRPPDVGGLPAAGLGTGNDSNGILSLILGLLGAAFVAGGSLKLMTTRSRRA
jgi:hypothetical protein